MSNIFQTKYMLAILSFFMIAHFFGCASAFSAEHYMSLFVSFLTCVFVAFSMLLLLVYRWLRAIARSTIWEITDLSTPDLNKNVFLVPAVLIGLGYVVLSLVYFNTVNYKTNTAYLVTFTYMEAAFTLVVFLIQSRFKAIKARRL